MNVHTRLHFCVFNLLFFHFSTNIFLFFYYFSSLFFFLIGALPQSTELSGLSRFHALSPLPPPHHGQRLHANFFGIAALFSLLLLAQTCDAAVFYTFSLLWPLSIWAEWVCLLLDMFTHLAQHKWLPWCRQLCCFHCEQKYNSFFFCPVLVLDILSAARPMALFLSLTY